MAIGNSRTEGSVEGVESGGGFTDRLRRGSSRETNLANPKELKNKLGRIRRKRENRISLAS